MDFKITISDDTLLSGIAWARTQYSLSLPRDDNGQSAKQLETDADYMQWIMEQAAASYAKQQLMISISAKIEAAHKSGIADLKSLADKLG